MKTKYEQLRNILISRNANGESLYMCNIAYNIMKDEMLYDDLTDRLSKDRSLENMIPCNKNVRNIKHSYCYFHEKDIDGRLNFLNRLIFSL